MIYYNEADLHTLLDSLTDGEHIKATWKAGNVELTAEGPMYKDDLHCSCFNTIRWTDGGIDRTLTSIEVARDEEVTITRDDEKALHALLDSLEGGETVTAEWHDEKGPMTLTGSAMSNGGFTGVRGFITFPLLWGDSTLHSVTVRRPVVQRWERDGDE